MSNVNSVSGVSSEIYLGPSMSPQMMFAQLQLAQAQMCKSQAELYMDDIKATQEAQEEAAKMIADARALRNEAKTSGKCTEMPPEMVEWCNKNDIDYDHNSNDSWHNAEEWDYNIESMMNYQETLNNDTQTKMVYLQDFIGQYNSYLQGANAAVSQANQTLTALATGR